MISSFSGAAYDSWLLNQADEYMESFCEGEPKVVGSEKEFEGYDSDGNIEYSTSYTYSCEDCDDRECEHWKDFHQSEWEEMQAELLAESEAEAEGEDNE